MAPSWSSETHPGWTRAEAEAAGKLWLQLRCAVCNCTFQIPWRLMPDFPPDEPASLVGCRLRCRRCGARPDPSSFRASGEYDDTLYDKAKAGYEP